MRAVVCVAGVLLFLYGAAAQAQTEWLPRPKLPRSADTTDWIAYYDYAVSITRAYPNRADTAFRWASRLDPSKGEPLFGRWVTFWLRDLTRFQKWLVDDPSTLDEPEVLAADSLYDRAMHRNPFVPQMLFVIPIDELPGRWSEDLGTRAVLAYARLDFARAADHLARLIGRNPARNGRWRFFRALTFVGMRAYDSAAAEMTVLARTLRERTQQTTSSIYESLELTEYRIGMLELAQGRLAPARAAFGRALEENLGFFPAHAMLGDIALAGRQWAAAQQAFAQAVEIAPDEPWIQYRYGAALIAAGRDAAAIDPLERAIALAPFYADPYRALARARAATGDRAGAIRALQDYLTRAPRRQSADIDAARRQLAAWQEGP